MSTVDGSPAAGAAATVRPADLHDPRLAVLVAEHLAEMEPTAPACSRHALTVDQFRDPRVTLWVAEAGSELVGSVALKDLGAGHLELKTMRVSPALRGAGLGRMLLRHALDEARRRGARRVSLETGAAEVFLPARELYRAHGFVDCEPFADYHPDRHSVFLTIAL